MKLRHFPMNSANFKFGGFATDQLRADGEDGLRFPRGHVPILDVDYSDDGASEPDGVNDFVHLSRSEQLDQH